MSDDDPLRDLQLGVQALRRYAERLEVLGGATGVRALHLPHQLWNVRRVLTAPRVRHLLADEVGLGKTVQVLMIINALALQSRERPGQEHVRAPEAVSDSGLRVLIVVPDQLMAQWRDELLARGHQAPSQQAGEELDALPPGVTLAWPGQLQTGDIDPDRYDLLVVDEFHVLRKRDQSEILSASPSFKHLLLLTATPPLHDAERLAELIEMLEPERFHAVRARLPSEAEPDQLLEAVLELEEPDDHALELVEEAIGRTIEPTIAGLAEALCMVRGVVRMRRDDWPDLFAAREHRSRVIEPNQAEERRQSLMWRYFSFLGDLSRDFDLDLLAQRVIRSPASLRQRVTYLRGHGHEREDLLRQVAEWLPREHGETRFDALCDLLSEIWLEDARAKILVAAGDNLTVDDLAKRLPHVLDVLGPEDAERELMPVSVRNQTRGAASIASPDEIDAAVRAFVSGEANLMLAAEVGQVGLNLQVTRDIVLYSVPWSPQEVEQWVGRVDRIGNSATAGHRTIRVHTIAQRGLVDERVLGVLEAALVLERSISLDPAAVERVTDQIREAALGDQGRSWSAVLEEARRLGTPDELDAVGSRWVDALPWTPAGARGYADALERRAPQEPCLTSPELAGLGARERGVRRWLDALRAAREYDIRRKGRGGDHLQGVRTIGYLADSTPRKLGMKTSSAFGRSQRISDATTVALGEDLIPSNHRPAWFLCRRRDLRQPPRREIRTDSGPRALYFLDHGSILHERLLSLWLAHGQTGPGSISARLPPEHPADPLRGAKVLVRIGLTDPAALLPGPEAALMMSPAAERDLLMDRWEGGLAHLVDADRRFLRELLPAQLCVVGVRRDGGSSLPVPASLLLSLLRPPTDAARVKQPTSRGRADIELDDADREELASAASSRVRSVWSPSLERARQAIDDRIYTLASDLAVQLVGIEHQALRTRAQARELEAERDRLEAASMTVSSTRRKLSAARRLLDDQLPARRRQLRAMTGFRIRALSFASRQLNDPEVLLYRDVLLHIAGR